MTEQRNAEKDAPRPIMRVSTAETSGPSGAGERGGENRNPRLDGRVRLSVPTLATDCCGSGRTEGNYCLTCGSYQCCHAHATYVIPPAKSGGTQ